uniref:Uncharacterized protein n=1 Tax=Arundo donax TaxID=35708 RepID=A0A0A9DWK5_ARUDO
MLVRTRSPQCSNDLNHSRHLILYLYHFSEFMSLCAPQKNLSSR